MMGDGDIIDFVKVKDAPALTVRTFDGRGCRHRQAVVGDHHVECGNCGAILDPLRVLMEIALKERTLQYSREEMKRVREEIYDWKRKLKNLRAQVNRLKRRVEKSTEE